MKIKAADQTVANDQQAVGTLKGIMGADQADINALAFQQAVLTQQLNAIKNNPTPNSLMVAAYLQGELDQVQDGLDLFTADLQIALVAYAQAQTQLLKDQIIDDTLNGNLIGLRNRWTQNYLTPPLHSKSY